MITKSNLKNLKKVGINIYGINQAFRDSKKSRNMIVYDATPEEVVRLVERALADATSSR